MSGLTFPQKERNQATIERTSAQCSLFGTCSIVEEAVRSSAKETPCPRLRGVMEKRSKNCWPRLVAGFLPNSSAMADGGSTPIQLYHPTLDARRKTNGRRLMLSNPQAPGKTFLPRRLWVDLPAEVQQRQKDLPAARSVLPHARSILYTPLSPGTGNSHAKPTAR
jgi:hypothetical protein